MGQLQERHDHAERDLATARHDIGTLTAERDHLANQVRVLVDGVTVCEGLWAAGLCARSRCGCTCSTVGACTIQHLTSGGHQAAGYSSHVSTLRTPQRCRLLVVQLPVTGLTLAMLGSRGLKTAALSTRHCWAAGASKPQRSAHGTAQQLHIQQFAGIAV
jgi:hypothetical protein